MQPPEQTFTLDARGLGQRIASLRRAHGWSQRRLAETAGVSHGYIALLELGRLPSPGKLRLDAIAHALSLASSDALATPAPEASWAARPHRAQDAGGPQGPDPSGSPIAYAPANASTSPAMWAQPGARPPAGAAGPGGAGPRAAEAEHAQVGTLRAAGGLDDARLRDSQAAGSSHGEGGRARTLGATSSASTPSNASNASTVSNASSNVVGSLEQLRPEGARPLPIFRWGACGDPRDLDSPPDPDRLEYPPPGRETLIGPRGFGVVVKGDSMAGRGIVDGDVVWVNPERPYGVGKVVLALVSDVDGEPAGMVVKTYARTEVGDCLLSETAAGRTPVICREFKVIGPVVGITSWRLPS